MQHVFQGQGAPTEAPTALGQHYIDLASGTHYNSVGTASAADWKAGGEGGAPTGSGAGEALVQYPLMASTDLTEGMLVNVYNDAGVAKIRPATTTQPDHHVHGFVLESAAANTMVTVYFTGVNDKLSGLSVGDQYLSDTPGMPSPFTPTMSGYILQTIGIAVSSTILIFNPSDPAELG